MERSDYKHFSYRSQVSHTHIEQPRLVLVVGLISFSALNRLGYITLGHVKLSYSLLSNTLLSRVALPKERAYV